MNEVQISKEESDRICDRLRTGLNEEDRYLLGKILEGASNQRISHDSKRLNRWATKVDGEKADLIKKLRDLLS